MKGLSTSDCSVPCLFAGDSLIVIQSVFEAMKLKEMHIANP